MGIVGILTEALRALRAARGWDQQTLAHRVGIDPSVISRLERGLQEDTRLSVLLALARAFQVSTDVLLVDPVIPPALNGDLLAAITTLAQLAPAQQRQVAALLRAYVANLPDQGEAG